MKASTQRFVMRASVAAVQGVLAALAFIPAAYASDEDPAERAQNQRISHHPVNEGKVACSDCHNP
ncbi:MAG: hypothetical protein ACXWG9_08390, partial [Usitatibacter sp.]